MWLQNRDNPGDRRSEALIDLCEAEDFAFLPWSPIQDLEVGGAVHDVAERLQVTSPQVALAWLLARSPMMLPIPGNGSVAHLEENVASSGLRLPAEDIFRTTGSG